MKKLTATLLLLTMILALLSGTFAYGGVQYIYVNDIVVFGSYEQDNKTDNGAEDIEWIVLAVEDDRILVVSRYALDCKRYHSNHSTKDFSYEKSYIRSWLNEEFLYTAFTKAELRLILCANVTADPNPEYGTVAGGDTEDKIFLLSAQEVKEYMEGNPDRRCAPTAYAVAQGAGVDKDVIAYDDKGHGNADCWWWTRTPGKFTPRAAIVRYDGSFEFMGEFVDTRSGAVRPAMWISLA